MVLCMWSLLWKGNFIYNYLIIIIQIFYRFCTDNYNHLCMSFKKKENITNILVLLTDVPCVLNKHCCTVKWLKWTGKIVSSVSIN